MLKQNKKNKQIKLQKTYDGIIIIVVVYVYIDKEEIVAIICANDTTINLQQKSARCIVSIQHKAVTTTTTTVASLMIGCWRVCWMEATAVEEV